MSKATRSSPCLYLPYSRRAILPKGVIVYDVSSYSDPPYCTLSPMWVHGGIPIPGMPGVTSDTVEGIWQGLKVIRGAIALRYFSGSSGKRGGKPSGHRYGDKLLKIVEAREKIYRVAYEWVLTHRIEPSFIEGFVALSLAGKT